MIANVLRDFWAQVFGTGWIDEAGTVYLRSIDGSDQWIRVDYRAWRERPLFAGKVYRR